MASIRNSISLQDQMTPVFRSIIRAMDQTLKAMQNLDKQANKGVQSRAYNQARRSIDQANKAINRMKTNMDRADRSAKNLEQTTGKIHGNMSRIQSSGFNLVNLSAALYLFRAIKQAVKDVMDSVDETTSIAARLGIFNTSSVYGKDELFGAVYRTALATRTGLTETGNLANRILISGAMKGEGASLGAIKLAGIINKAAIAGGGTQDEVRRALLQLSQALASGMLQGDELRALREQTPYLMDVLAKGLSKIEPDKFANVTLGRLKELGAEGELTSDRILKAFLAMEGEVDAAFQQMPKTFSQAMTQLNSTWQYFLYLLSQSDGALGILTQKVWELADYLASAEGEQLLQRLAEAITLAVNAFLMFADLGAQAIAWLSQHVEILNALLFALGVVMVGVAIKATIAWIAAFWPFLLIVAVLGIIIYTLLKLGATMNQIVGSMIGAITWFIGLLWQVCLWFGNVGLAAWEVIKNIGLWFANLGLGIWNVLSACAHNVQAAFVNAFLYIKEKFLDFKMTVLEGVLKIIQTLNKIPGVNISTDNISGTIQNLAAEKAEAIASKMDYKDLGEEFRKGYNTYSYGSVSAAYNTFDAFSAGWGTEWFSKGYDFGSDLVDSLSGLSDQFSMGLGTLDNMDKALAEWDPNSVTMNGGYLDKIGEVNISDEDLKLLRDIAAKEFLLNVTQVTPSANIQFGDVRETADVNKIMEAIEDMVEDALASILVID